MCSWLHTNNDDLEKNICSLSRQVITFFFHRCCLILYWCFFFLCFHENNNRKFVAFWPILSDFIFFNGKNIATKLHNQSISDQKIKMYKNEMEKSAFVHLPSSKWNCTNNSHLETSVWCAFSSLCCWHFEISMQNDRSHSQYNNLVFNGMEPNGHEKTFFLKVFELLQLWVCRCMRTRREICVIQLSPKWRNSNLHINHEIAGINHEIENDNCCAPPKYGTILSRLGHWLIHLPIKEA